MADHILLAPYGDIDLDSTPVVVLGCKHIFTAETLDGHMGISDVYELDDQGEVSTCACRMTKVRCLYALLQNDWDNSLLATVPADA